MQPKKMVESITQKTVDLLALAHPEIHIIRGGWKFEGCTLSLLEPVKYGLLALPYLPPEEYDLRVVFSARHPGPVNIVLAYDRLSFLFELAPEFAGLAMLRGLHASNPENPTHRRQQNLFQSDGTRHEIILQIRHCSISAMFDKRELFTWRTDYYDLGIDTPWRPLLPCLGLGGFQSAINFHSVVVTELDGYGYELPPSAFHRHT